MTSDETEQTVSTEAVSQQLKKAREKHGLSVSQIADAQHLRATIIQAIENGDYGQIGSELFLKGYIRAYAKQVGLSGDAVIAELDRELEPARQQKAREREASPLVDIERRKNRKRRIGKLLMIIMAFVLVGAAVILFVVPKFTAGEAGASLSTTSTPGDQAVAANSAEEPTGSGVQPEPNTGVDVETPVLPDNAVDSTIEDRIPIVTLSTEPALAQPSVSEDAGPVSGNLEIAFSGDCWVQVRDATGHQLTSSLKRAGDTLDVSGETPLNVVIGAVDTVKTIRFQGEAVNLRDFPVENNRVEFTLTI
ncbi:RodZ domain-containing protein [Marinobacter antarcticus]|uniref:Helix-turn-helix domain-containing protein n=3 Tax=root TaxID=1 RepID=A0A831R5P5_9GAMM|nr:RodZ domain-containing protein [Marinobacter antarcticus]HEA53427.1 helix-turn-helix domain-containing protein [Marinobacter antarcticus]